MYDELKKKIGQLQFPTHIFLLHPHNLKGSNNSLFLLL